MSSETIPSLKDFLRAIHPLEDHILDPYVNSWQEIEVPRKTIMTHAGDTERFIYFVIEGIQRSYLLHDDKEHVIAFSYPPSFSGIPNSFISQTPSNYFLETITNSRFLRISKLVHEEFMANHHELETLLRKATELVLLGIIDRHAELMAYNMETRFKTFTSRSPHLLNQVPHKDLASYLRIDPTNFSKLLGTVRL